VEKGKQMKKPRFLWILVGIVALLLAACPADDPDPEVADPDEPDETEEVEEPVELTSMRFQLNWTWYPADHAYFQVALDQGFFEDEGLDVTIQEGSGSATTASLVGTGDSPMGFVDASTHMFSIGEGMPLTAIGVVNQISPMAAIFKAERGYETIQDLAGTRVATVHGDPFALLFPAVLRANDMDPDEVEFVGTPNPPAKEVAVLTDEAEVFLGWSTEQARRLEVTEGIEMGWITFADAGVNTLNMSIIANNSWLEDNPDAAAAFNRAVQRAIEFTIDDPRAAAEIFSEAHPDFDVELAFAQIEESIPLLQTEHSEGQPYLWSAEEDWAETRRILADFAELEPEEDLSVYYTNEFVE
jgi:NitT/TauT family transport system substrate-binding protein